MSRSFLSPFAHLAKSKAKSDEDEDAKRCEEEEKDKDAKAAEDDKDDDEKKSKAASEDDDEKDDDKKSKAKAEDDDEDDDEKEPEAKAARGRERARIRAIVTSDLGTRYPAAALHLATGTATPRKQAIEMLAAMETMLPAAATQKDALRDRMAAVPQPSVGAGDTSSSPTLAQQILAAGKKARGEA